MSDIPEFLLLEDWDQESLPSGANIPDVWYHAGSVDWDPTRGGTLGSAVHVGTLEQAQTRLEVASKRESDVGIHEFQIIKPMHDTIIRDLWANFIAHGQGMEGTNDVVDVLVYNDYEVPGYDEDDDERGKNSDLSEYERAAQDAFARAGFYYWNNVEGEGISAIVKDSSWLEHLGREATTEKVGRMNELEFRDWLSEAIYFSMDENSGDGVDRIDSFEEAGLMTSNEGLVVTMEDGSQFQLQIVQSQRPTASKQSKKLARVGDFEDALQYALDNANLELAQVNYDLDELEPAHPDALRHVAITLDNKYELFPRQR